MKFRIARVPALAAVAVLIVGLLAHAWTSAWMAATDRRLAAEDQIRRVAWVAAHSTELRQRLIAVKADPQLADAYLPFASDDEATATLQRLVKQAIDGASGGILSAQPLAATTEGEFRAISARFQVSLTTPALVSLLSALENSKPYVFVDSAEVFSSQGGAPAGQVLGDPNQRPLTVQFDVRALMVAAQRG